MLDFLSAALLSAEYDRALSRALGMAECPVIPFFGAFLKELREIVQSSNKRQEQGQSQFNSYTSSNQHPQSHHKFSKSSRERDQSQQREKAVVRQ